jgi:CYTH domain-containing protein
MPLEIERKFLVRDDGWRAAALGPAMAIRQGYLAAGGEAAPSVRVRIVGDAGVLTVKGPGTLARLEFEYPIPLRHADAMFEAGLCAPPLIEKRRTRVGHAGLVWEIDEFAGCLAGLVLAEVELPSADHALTLPPWAGREVTGDPRYLNATLARANGPPGRD